MMKLAYMHVPIPKLVYDKQEFDLISISIDIIQGRLLFMLASLVVSIQLGETVTIAPAVCTPVLVAASDNYLSAKCCRMRSALSALDLIGKALSVLSEWVEAHFKITYTF
jgi:hypothetical protein